MAELNQQFDSFDEWLEKGQLWTRRPKSTEAAICFDAKGRICNGVEGFKRARNESAFPVRWLWPSQVPEILNRAENVAIAIGMGWEVDPAVDDLVAIIPGFASKRATEQMKGAA